MAHKKSGLTKQSNKRVLYIHPTGIVYKRRKNLHIRQEEKSNTQLEFIDGDLEDVDSNNPILRMARSAEKLGLIASRDDIADNFDEILQQVIIESDDD